MKKFTLRRYRPSSTWQLRRWPIFRDQLKKKFLITLPKIENKIYVAVLNIFQPTRQKINHEWTWRRLKPFRSPQTPSHWYTKKFK